MCSSARESAKYINISFLAQSIKIMKWDSRRRKTLTATERGSWDLDSRTWPFHKLDWLLSEETYELSLHLRKSPMSTEDKENPVINRITYSNFMLTECHFQKHTMPSAPVDPKYRDVPFTAGQNWGNWKKRFIAECWGMKACCHIRRFFHSATVQNAATTLDVI